MNICFYIFPLCQEGLGHNRYDDGSCDGEGQCRFFYNDHFHYKANASLSSFHYNHQGQCSLSSTNFRVNFLNREGNLLHHNYSRSTATQLYLKKIRFGWDADFEYFVVSSLCNFVEPPRAALRGLCPNRSKVFFSQKLNTQHTHIEHGRDWVFCQNKVLMYKFTHVRYVDEFFSVVWEDDLNMPFYMGFSGRSQIRL